VDFLEGNLDKIVFEELNSDADEAGIPERLARFSIFLKIKLWNI